MSISPENRPVTQSAISVHLPVALLAFAIAVFLFTQQRATSAQSEYLRWQRGNLEKQQKQLLEYEGQMKAAYTQREPAVQQALQVQSVFQNILSDVMAAADRGNPDAKAIVEAWRIQRPAPAPGAAGAPGAAAPGSSGTGAPAPAGGAPAATPNPAAK